MIGEGRDPFRYFAADILLVEARARDAIGMPVQTLRAVIEIGEYIRRDAVVVVEEIAFGILFFGPKDLAEMREAHFMPADLYRLFVLARGKKRRAFFLRHRCRGRIARDLPRRAAPRSFRRRGFRSRGFCCCPRGCCTCPGGGAIALPLRGPGILRDLLERLLR